MIKGESEELRYRVAVSNGVHTIISDTTEEKGGGGSAIRPHELLEAAFAACLNMTIRMYADKKNIPLQKVITHVFADRSQPGKTIFHYSFSFTGEITDEQREALNRIVESCPVRKTLSNQLYFTNGT